jgi:hypothetical protein
MEISAGRAGGRVGILGKKMQSVKVKSPFGLAVSAHAVV